MKTILLLAARSHSLLAGETRSWIQADYPDFEKGNRKNLSIRSDGRLSLAPKTVEIYDSSTAYLWALAQDSHGNLYTAGGPGAKLFRISPDGKGEKIAEFDALEIHAIAIDSKDRMYVATSPDGKIYRVETNGKSEEFYDPKQKYIWSMLCDPAGNLYVATGDQGEVHRVTPAGKGEVFFKSDETHARSLAFDHDGNLIVGTEPGGLVFGFLQKGEGFVLYQMPKREVTALAIGPGNEIYAAAVGSKTAALPIAPLPPSVPAGARPPGMIALPGAAPAPAPVVAPLTIPGGSDVYLISPQRGPERLWSGTQDVVYALALDPDGHLLIGSGNKGDLYRVETHSLYSTLVAFPVAEVTALLAGKDGALYAITGNVGKVFRVGPGLEHEGSIESDVFDTGGFSSWGRISAAGDLHGGKVRWRHAPAISIGRSRTGAPGRAHRGFRRRPSQHSAGALHPVPGCADRLRRGQCFAHARFRRDRVPPEEDAARDRPHRDHTAELPVPAARRAAHSVQPIDADASAAWRRDRENQPRRK